MTQNRKYFGMTTTQLAILAGLAVAACLLFAVAGLLVLRGGLGGSAPAPQASPIPQFTATPFVLPTLTPTETPTPVPYEMLIPKGWVQFKTTLVEIWLPKGFKKEKPKKSDNPMSSMTDEMEMVGFPTESSVFPTIVSIAYEPTTGSLDDFLEIELASLSDEDAHVVEMRKVSINSWDAIRLVMEMRMESFEVNGLLYVFQDGGTVWLVSYVSQINDFYTMLDTFEKSIKTFRIVR